jgi:hypothetical protein
VRVTIGVQRKEGRPSFGSEGASVELSFDLPDDSITANPAGLVDQIRRGQALADRAVEESLARTRDAHQVEPDRQPRPVIEPDRARQPSQARPPSEPEPDRQAPRRWDADPGSKPHDGAPRSGRELVPWSRKREQSGQFPGLFKRLVAYGRSQGFPEMMTAWSYSEVGMAVSAVLGAGYDDEPEPAPSRNGYHNGNGNGR